MILSTRGWGREEFRTATPEFMEAVRFALFAEKVGPLLSKWEEIQNTTVTRGMPSGDRLRLGRAKVQAGEVIPAIKAVLYPEDDEIV